MQGQDSRRSSGRLRWWGATAALAWAMAAATAWAIDVPVTLSGNAESPPVTSSGTASGRFTINTDGTITGGITTSDVAASGANLHEGAVGVNGPVVLQLVKRGQYDWVVPDGARLSDAHYKSFQAGNLYVNVPTATQPDGELRAQLRP